jgi:putative glycosyltransferase (TIGR04372 family)
MRILEELKKITKDIPLAIRCIRFMLRMLRLIEGLFFIFVLLINRIFGSRLRIGALNPSVVGDFLFDLEIYLQLVKDSDPDVILTHPRGSIANLYSYELASNHFRISTRWYSAYMILDFFNCEKYLIRARHFGKLSWSSRDVRDLLFRSHIATKIPGEDWEELAGFLSSLGVRGKYACVIARDSGYKNHYQSDLKHDWSYTSNRDSSIESCQLAVRFLLEQGFVVFRMGRANKRPLFERPVKDVYEYDSLPNRSEALDILLFARADLILAGHAGIHVVGHIFRRPICQMNVSQIGYLLGWQPNNVILFKNFRDRDGNLLSVQQLFSDGVFRFYRNEQFEDYGLVLEENSPQQILESLTQLLAGMKTGTFSDNFVAQDKFRLVYEEHNDGEFTVLRASIADCWLDQYKD